MDIPVAPYYLSAPENRVTQGDIFWDCPIVAADRQTARIDAAGEGQPPKASVASLAMGTAIVLSQACDLEKPACEWVVVARILTMQSMIQGNQIKKDDIPKIKKGQVFGLSYLPPAVHCLGDATFPESVVDLRQLFTVERLLLDDLCHAELRKLSVGSVYREAINFALASTYARIGTPERPGSTVDVPAKIVRPTGAGVGSAVSSVAEKPVDARSAAVGQG